jgi:hypothetical protein
MGFVSDIKDQLSGDAGSDAAKKASGIQAASGEAALQEQRESRERAQEFFQPIQGVGQRGIDQSSFLANPQEQFDFLQSNPLFQMGLDNANRVTQQSAASRGRLSAGDTLQQLSNNSMLVAQPLIDRQRQDIGNLLNVGTSTAAAQANIETGGQAQITDLITGIGNTRASGVVGSQNARAAALAGVTDQFNANNEGFASIFGASMSGG